MDGRDKEGDVEEMEMLGEVQGLLWFEGAGLSSESSIIVGSTVTTSTGNKNSQNQQQGGLSVAPDKRAVADVQQQMCNTMIVGLLHLLLSYRGLSVFSEATI